MENLYLQRRVIRIKTELKRALRKVVSIPSSELYGDSPLLPPEPCARTRRVAIPETRSIRSWCSGASFPPPKKLDYTSIWWSTGVGVKSYGGDNRGGSNCAKARVNSEFRPKPRAGCEMNEFMCYYIILYENLLNHLSLNVYFIISVN